ncbi:glycosyltransferase [Enterococcus quebecensis]|uniref:Glycosyl transferase family 1 domain-containing protein n=1 Tax=Enterococcus quebecensis TaxID=903983 RepID=A0A1E5GR20_9ENTE|nr:glycosyltransferase [Enterococcus quebecensis]OEG14680.1 hypothetical protein BCR23_12670 [Enterococcus quebecensis]OJG73267.1 hypothetical protein RV12_GL000674 [Enterococcus quebecensis]
MNICLVNVDFKMGGQQKVVLDLGKQLSNFENQISFYSFRPAVPFFDIEGLDMMIDLSDDELSVLSRIKRKVLRKTVFSDGKANPVAEFSKRHQRMLEYLKERKIDLVILNGGFLTAFSKSIKEYLPSIKVISWQHNMAEIYLENYYSEIKDKYLEGLKYSDSVVCLTKSDKEVFAKYNDYTINIPNSVTVSKKKQCEDCTSNDIIFVSRYNVESKGIDYLIELVKLLPSDVRVKFAGSGTKKQERLVKKMISKSGLSNRIILLGALNDEELSELYQQGRVFLSTSRWEGFGLSIVEAMTFGLPVVSFDTTGPREIIGNNEYGIVIKSFDIFNMAKEVERLLKDDAHYEELSRLAKKRSKDFIPKKIAKQWEIHIQEVFK